MAVVYTLEQIKEALSGLDMTGSIEKGFIAYSRGEVVVPPVGELLFEDPPGDTHIKYGYIKGDDIYVIKIASGFYKNPGIGLPSSSGLMLVFSQKTGVLQSVLLDEGYLTDVRTAIAGEIAAKYLAPEILTAIGVIGTGIQARMQVMYLKSVTPCRQVVVWGRSREERKQYKTDMEAQGFSVTPVDTPAQVAQQASLIVTTTPAHEPLLFSADIRPGTHITAMGSDTDKKQELASDILARADIVVADSLSQCKTRGEISKALAAGAVKEADLHELGSYIVDHGRGHRKSGDITVADLTGVAVQDVQIAAAVCSSLAKSI